MVLLAVGRHIPPRSYDGGGLLVFGAVGSSNFGGAVLAFTEGGRAATALWRPSPWAVLGAGWSTVSAERRPMFGGAAVSKSWSGPVAVVNLGRSRGTLGCLLVGGSTGVGVGISFRMP